MNHLNSGKKFWVVRAGKKSAHFNYFYDNNTISIGHWNKVFELNSSYVVNADLLNEGELARIKGIIAPRPNPKTAPSRGDVMNFNQGLNFITEISIGDYVVTIGRDQIILGEIKSDAYSFNEKSVALTQHAKPDHSLYRDVEWIADKQRGKAPSIIKRSIQSPLTVFSIDTYKLQIFSWIYPIYSHEDELFLATNIRSKNSISSYHKSQYQLMLGEMELAAKAIIANNITSEHENFIAAVLSEMPSLSPINRTLSEQAEYMSPGISWSKVKIGATGAAIVAIMFASMYSNPALAQEIYDAASLHGEMNITLSDIQSLGDKFKDEFKFSDIKNNLELALSEIIDEDVSSEELDDMYAPSYEDDESSH
jgi:hypothetical protein